MYKNLSEMAAHEKGLWSEVVIPKKHFFYVVYYVKSRREQFFFQSIVFLHFKKVVAAIHPLMDTIFILEEHLQPWINYIQCIWQIFLF